MAAEYVILQREYEQNNGPHPAVAAVDNYILHLRRQREQEEEERMPAGG
jgi:hypothetical protein